MDKVKTLCIVSCGKRKIWDKQPNSGPTKARYVYTSQFTTKYIKYAKMLYPSDWIILSAKYGFLYPDDIIPETYDVTFSNKNSNSISIDELHNQIINKKLNDYNKIIVLGSTEYAKIVIDLFSDKWIITPLIHLSFGMMNHKITNLIKNEELKHQRSLSEWV